MLSRLSWLFSGALAVLMLAPEAGAGEIRFPLTVDHDLLRMALRQHLQHETGGRLELWRDRGTLGLHEPGIVAEAEIVVRTEIDHVAAAGDARPRGRPKTTAPTSSGGR